MELNKIYLGDAYELIKQIPDKSIDLVVTDPPYEFDMGGNSSLAQRKAKSKDEIYNLDTALTKQRQKYLDYLKEHGKDEESERLRIIANGIDNGNNIRFISKGITNEILKELVRVMKKGNIYIFCNKNQIRQYLDFFGDLGWNLDLLVWNKTNCIPTINNNYLANLEYCVFARESGTPLYGSFETKSKCYTSACNKHDKDLFLHPTIKPLPFIKNLIINSSLEGG